MVSAKAEGDVALNELYHHGPLFTLLSPSLTHPASASDGPTKAKAAGAGLWFTEHLGEAVGSWVISKLIVGET